MTIEDIFKITAAIITSVGGGALIISFSANWLASIWAKRMLQNERSEHSEKLENLKKELEFITNTNITRHHDKLSSYRDVIHLLSHILRELEAVFMGYKKAIDPEVEKKFSINRFKAYGYISLVSNQIVMDKFNEMIDFFIPIIYENKKGTWIEMRAKADALLNAMRNDLGITDEVIVYRGSR